MVFLRCIRHVAVAGALVSVSIAQQAQPLSPLLADASELANDEGQAHAPPAAAILSKDVGLEETSEAQAQEAQAEGLPHRAFHDLHKEDQGAAGEEGAEGGEEEGEHEEGHISAVRITTAILLLGFVGFIMAKFYLVNWPQHEIRRVTWQVTSNSISIFCAVLIFSAFGRVLAHLEKLTNKTHHVHLALFAATLGWWVVIECAMQRQMRKALHLAAIGTLGSHILGFNALYAFGGLATSDALGGKTWSSMTVTTILYVLFVIACGMAGSQIRKRVNEEDGEVDEYEKRWAEQCIDTENDFMCMGGSFLVSLAIRFAITGEMPPMHEGFEGKSQTEIYTLLIVAVVCLIACGPATHFLHTVVENRVARGFGIIRFAKNLQGTLAMTSAWCIYFWAQWQFYFYVDNRPMLACVTSAFGMSVFGVFVVFFLEFLGSSGYGSSDSLDALVTAIGLLIGLCWEQTFDMAVETVVELKSEEDMIGRDIVLFGLSSWLVLIVLPAWMVYILPKTDEDLQKLVPPLTPVTMICREADYDTSDLSDSDYESGGVMAMELADDKERQLKMTELEPLKP